MYISFSVSIPVGFYKTKKGHIVKVLNTLRFLDSFQFKSQSLDSLAKTLKKEDFALLKHYFTKTSPNNDWTLLCEKGFFPYRSLDSFAKFNQPLGKLMSLKISTRKHWIFITHSNAALWVTTTIYMETDVLILADVFLLFRQVCMKVYSLDPAHFFSALNLSWEVMLITTRVTLGLLTDIDMLFFEKGIRGGINGIGELRHFVANNKHLGSFDVSQPSVHGAFFYVTSIYAGTMQQTLPLDPYSWNETITLAKDLNTSDVSPFCYFVEVDLDYPIELHDSHNDLPLAPEKLSNQQSWLSLCRKRWSQNCI